MFQPFFLQYSEPAFETICTAQPSCEHAYQLLFFLVHLCNWHEYNKTMCSICRKQKMTGKKCFAGQLARHSTEPTPQLCNPNWAHRASFNFELFFRVFTVQLPLLQLTWVVCMTKHHNKQQLQGFPIFSVVQIDHKGVLYNYETHAGQKVQTTRSNLDPPTYIISPEIRTQVRGSNLVDKGVGSLNKHPTHQHHSHRRWSKGMVEGKKYDM